MQPDLGQGVQDGRGVLQLDPVQLKVGAGGEVPVPAIVGAGDLGQPVQLLRVEGAVGDGDPQHVGMELQIQAVHQAQRLELLLGDLAGEASLDLGAELRGPVRQHLRV